MDLDEAVRNLVATVEVAKGNPITRTAEIGKPGSTSRHWSTARPDCAIPVPEKEAARGAGADR